MSNAIDIAVIDKVIARMNLPDDRPAADPRAVQRRLDSVLLLILPEVPSEFCKAALGTYFLKYDATETECLQAWALYMDINLWLPFMAWKKKETINTGGVGSLAVAS